MKMVEEYTYNRTWDEIEEMLDNAERKQHFHSIKTGDTSLGKKERMYHARAFKGLEGVINALRWTLGDRKMSRKKVLGDE
tara:strand:+ start:89 stop:328 length:240 start_codon:yes stop_codon:yes gene_type:complete